MPNQYSPEMISQLVGSPLESDYTSGPRLGQMQQSLHQLGVSPMDSGAGGDLLARLLEVERTRRLSDPQGNAKSAENTRRGGSGLMDWFLSPLKQAGYGGSQ